MVYRWYIGSHFTFTFFVLDCFENFERFVSNGHKPKVVPLATERTVYGFARPRMRRPKSNSSGQSDAHPIESLSVCHRAEISERIHAAVAKDVLLRRDA